LSETREQFHNLQEEYDTSVEELQASNEEVQSSNEELQSLNEELETSNEELESANEELTTLNEELATRNTELRESEQRLREQAELLEMAPVLARSLKDRIIFWNRGAEELYGFTKEEALGQTAHLLLSAQYSMPWRQSARNCSSTATGKARSGTAARMDDPFVSRANG
jgi:two-component system CheB/CheR fusion protein